MTPLAAYLAGKLPDRATRRRVARALGVPERVVSAWLAGEPPDLEGALRIAHHFALPPVEVFALVGRPDWAALVTEPQESNLRLVRLDEDVAYPPIAYRLQAACDALGIGQAKMAALIRRGVIRPRVLDSQRLFPRAELERFVEDLPFDPTVDGSGAGEAA